MCMILFPIVFICIVQMTLADYSKFMLCDKFCIQWLLSCMDVLECVINTIQYNTYESQKISSVTYKSYFQLLHTAILTLLHVSSMHYSHQGATILQRHKQRIVRLQMIYIYTQLFTTVNQYTVLHTVTNKSCMWKKTACNIYKSEFWTVLSRNFYKHTLWLKNNT